MLDGFVAALIPQGTVLFVTRQFGVDYVDCQTTFEQVIEGADSPRQHGWVKLAGTYRHQQAYVARQLRHRRCERNGFLPHYVGRWQQECF
jgi:hypothetical protein